MLLNFVHFSAQSSQPHRSTRYSRNRLLLAHVHNRNHVTRKIVRMTQDDADDSTPRNFGSCKETHEKKSEGKIRRLQGDEVETHFEEGISTCPVIQNEVAQRDTDNDVRRNEQTQNTCAKRAVNEHPEEVGLVVLKGVALQTPHTLHIEDCREQKSNRELAGKENGWNQTQETSLGKQNSAMN